MVANGSELLTACKFYFEAQGIEDKPILEISGLSVESPVAGDGGVLGSSRDGKKLRQATPTNEQFTKVIVKVVASDDIALYTWYKEFSFCIQRCRSCISK